MLPVNKLLMKFVDEYRDKDLIHKLTGHIKRSATGRYVFMEVCGGHTSAIHRFGIPSLLPSCIELISGPGCPVCVTPAGFIDKAVLYSKMEGVIIVTFGDLVRVPGSFSSLEKAKSEGADVRTIFSGLEALSIAETNPDKIVIFPAIGFETTAPGTSVTVMEARRKNLKNFLIISAHKIMPPAMDMVVREGTMLNGFICPGHVAAITGSGIFEFLPRDYNLGCVITGFEPADILQAILMLVNQVNRKQPVVETAYTRAVKPEGNPVARQNISEVFEKCDTAWRGFGMIKESGLKLKDDFMQFDAEKMMPVSVTPAADNPSCICGDILRGLKRPVDCSLFGTACIPENPVGACMVSPEGACNTCFKYSAYA
jgi:hydrogenase expression/formation protein HypD